MGVQDSVTKEKRVRIPTNSEVVKSWYEAAGDLPEEHKERLKQYRNGKLKPPSFPDTEDTCW